MKQFSEYLLEVSETKAVDSDELFRLDDCPLSRKAKSYDMDSSGSSSDKTGKLKHTYKVTGLFTDTLGDVVPYAAGRKTPFIMVVPLDKKIKGDVYFRNEDKKHIKSAKPILSQFSKKQGFKKTKIRRMVCVRKSDSTTNKSDHHNRHNSIYVKAFEC